MDEYISGVDEDVALVRSLSYVLDAGLDETAYSFGRASSHSSGDESPKQAEWKCLDSRICRSICISDNDLRGDLFHCAVILSGYSRSPRSFLRSLLCDSIGSHCDLHSIYIQ